MFTINILCFQDTLMSSVCVHDHCLCFPDRATWSFCVHHAHDYGLCFLDKVMPSFCADCIHDHGVCFQWRDVLIFCRYPPDTSALVQVRKVNRVPLKVLGPLVPSADLRDAALALTDQLSSCLHWPWPWRVFWIEPCVHFVFTNYYYYVLSVHDILQWCDVIIICSLTMIMALILDRWLFHNFV